MSSASADRGPVRVGIIVGTETGRFGPWEIPAATLPRSYVTAVQGAGAVPILYPAGAELIAHPEIILDGVDAVILAGGRDIGPDTYDERPHPRTDAPDGLRDRAELALARAAVAADVPTLGICRGMQLLNIVFGGTLDQHIPDSLGHDDHSASHGTFRRHDVTFSPGSLASRAYRSQLSTSIFTAHHQGLGRLGTGLVVTARSVPDSVIEAIESPEHHFVLGVQWHPEQETDSPVFEALAAEARTRRLSPAAAGSPSKGRRP